MKPETTLSPDQMKNFSIDVVDGFEGCAEATVFLKRIYGEEIADLSKRKKDFITLSLMGKAHWIINFLLNTITKPYRAKFIAGLISENMWLLKNDALKIEIINCMCRVQTYAEAPTKALYDDLAHDYGYINSKREEIKDQISSLGDKAISTSQERFEALMVQSQFLKGILYFIMEVDGSFTRSSVSFCRQLGEAIQWKFMRDSGVDYNKKTLESCASSLIDYVGYFVETDEKGV